MYRIAITGGKGGTGKTLFATNLAYKFAIDGKKVLLLDCDVENPNTHILLNHPQLPKEDAIDVNVFLPIFDTEKCTKCGICSKACYRHAILQFLDQPPSVMEHMCSGCLTCFKVCPENAIKEGSKKIGTRYFLPQIYPNLDLVVGELFPSEAVSVKVVENIIEFGKDLEKHYDYDVVVVDTAPGAHCDVEMSLAGADQIIAITEPTPFGLHDLKRILELIKITGQKGRIVMNRANLSDFKEEFLEELKSVEEDLPGADEDLILGEIPVDEKIIENYAHGLPFVSDERTFPGKEAFENIFYKIEKYMKK